MKYYLIAGEASGDLHASNLMKGLLAEDPDADFRFFGGEMMEAVGGTKVRDYKDTAVMGMSDVVKNISKIAEKLKACKEDILAWKPDVVILVDYPGFNMKIARFCHYRKIKVFYYIAPKTWASRESRNRKLKAWVDRMFIVFPFEKEYFDQAGIPYIYEGNPLVDAIDSAVLTRPEEGRYIAILAGSRKGEISRTMPVAMKMADILHAKPEFAGHKFLVGGAPARTMEDYEPYIEGRDYVKVLFGRTYDILSFADAALVNSGTASLEAALLGTPQVVCWSTSFVTAFLANYVVNVMDHIKFISLGNLILGRLSFRELIQYDFTPEESAREITRLVTDLPYRERMKADYAEIRELLGGSGASRKVAAAMISELKNR